jgi:DNA-binding CsgD family transcriptional regulator
MLDARRDPGPDCRGLELSGSAVHGHLRTARRKLECATIEQAIAKARRLDLIQ